MVLYLLQRPRECKQLLQDHRTSMFQSTSGIVEIWGGLLYSLQAYNDSKNGLYCLITPKTGWSEVQRMIKTVFLTLFACTATSMPCGNSYYLIKGRHQGEETEVHVPSDFFHCHLSEKLNEVWTEVSSATPEEARSNLHLP